MREILTAIAVLLIVALLAAIAGPYFVDWNSQRARIEQELTARLGLPVRIDGDVTVRLLPTPTLRAKAVHLAGTDSPASLSMDEIALFLAPQALLQGRFQITEMSLQNPQLALDRTALATGSADAGINLDALRRISIERLSITNGSVRERSAAEPVVDGIDGIISAPSLAGPIRGSGSFALGGYRPTYRFSTGEATADKVSLDLLIEDPSAGMKLESQGEYRFRETADGAAGTFAGAVTLGGSTAMSLDASAPGVPWRAQAKAAFGASEARLSELVLTLGQRPAEITLRGDAAFNVSDGLMTVSLASRQIDADQLFGTGNPKRIAPADLIGRLQGALGAMLAGGAGNAAEAGLAAPELALSLTAEAITMGGDQIRDARLRLRAGGPGVRLETFAAGLPFNGRVSFLGDDFSGPETGGGRLAVSLPDLPRFTGWALQTAARRGGLDSLQLAGNMRWDDARIAVSDAALVTNGVSWTGALGWTPPDPATNPTGLIELQLQAPIVDLDRLPLESFRAGTGPSNLPAFDLNLSVEKLAFDGGSFGGVTLDAERSGERLTIRDITVEDFGGASLSAKGEMTSASDAIEARIKASDLTALTSLAQRAMPGPIADWLSKTKGSLAPADVSISLTTSTAADGAGRNRSLIVNGSFHDSTARISGLWRENVGPGGSASEPSSLGLSIEGPDAGRLLDQFGFSTEVRGLGPANLLANLRGSIATGFDIEAAADAAFGKGSLSGKITLTNPSYPLVGTLTLNAFDLGAVSRATGIDPDFLPSGRSGYVTGEVWGSPAKLLITKMTAELAGSTYRGEIAFKLDQGGKVAGQLRVDKLDLSPVLGIPFGAWPKTQPGELWARAPFSASDPPVLDGDLWIEAEELTLSPGVALSGARFVLRFARNLLNFEQADARFLGGRVAGQVMMRRSEEAVQISSKLDLTDIDLSRLGQAGLDARISGKIENSAIGLSPASLIGSLAGGGVVSIRNVILSALDPGALIRVAKEGLDTFSEAGGQALAKRFEEELARAPLRAPEVSAQVSMAGGTMRLGPVSFPVDGVAIEAAGSADLKTLAVNGRVQMMSKETVPGIDAPPQAGISWTGLLGNLTRRTDFGAFTAAVTERAIEIEQERTAAFEEDLRERAMFNRRLKADRAQIAAEQEAKIAAQRDAAITEQADRIRLHFERIQLEAAARRERADSIQELQREGRRATAFTASTRPDRRPRNARPAVVEEAPVPLTPDAGAPIDLTPPQPTQ